MLKRAENSPLRGLGGRVQWPRPSTVEIPVADLREVIGVLQEYSRGYPLVSVEMIRVVTESLRTYLPRSGVDRDTEARR